MAADADNVRVAITGGVRVADVGTTAPTTPTASYAAGWAELGYLSEDGITESPNQDTTEIKAWQNNTIVRRVISSAETTFAFTVIETNTDVWMLYYPGSDLATDTGISTLTVKVPAPDPRAFAFDIIDGDVHTRIIVPKGEISERGELVYAGDEPIGYEFTMTCYPASDGTVMLKITDDTAIAEPA